MKQILLVTQREYLVQVRKKSFIILTVAMPLLMVGLFALILFFAKANQETTRIAVIDNSGLFTTTFNSTDDKIYAFYEDKELESLKDSLTLGKNLEGILLIPKTDSNYVNLKTEIQLLSNKSIGVSDLSSLQNKISDRIETLRFEQKGVSATDVEAMRTAIAIQVKKHSTAGISATDQSFEMIKMAISSLLMYATFMFIMIYGIRVMRSVLEEKSNRVVEIIISSIKPFDLMMGKILGTTLVALTQFIIWISFIVIILFAIPLLMPEADFAANQNVQTPNMTTEISSLLDNLFRLNYTLIIFSFLNYFFWGYLLYSAFFAAIGASVDNETETQQFMWIGLAPLMLGVYGSFSIIDNPDGPVGFWLSMIPFTSPVSMMMRIAYGVPTWQLILSILILIISVFIMVWFSAKIYKAGILMYGQKPSLKDWYNWLKM